MRRIGKMSNIFIPIETDLVAINIDIYVKTVAPRGFLTNYRTHCNLFPFSFFFLSLPQSRARSPSPFLPLPPYVYTVYSRFMSYQLHLNVITWNIVRVPGTVHRSLRELWMAEGGWHSTGCCNSLTPTAGNTIRVAPNRETVTVESAVYLYIAANIYILRPSVPLPNPLLDATTRLHDYYFIELNSTVRN